MRPVPVFIPDEFDKRQELIVRSLQLQYEVYVTSFSHIKLFFDKFLNMIWLARVTTLNGMDNNFSCNNNPLPKQKASSLGSYKSPYIYLPEARGDAFCVGMNFNISKVGYCN